MSFPGKQMHVNGVNLNVYVEGRGPAVLLLHGFPDSNALWRGVIPALVRQGYTVIAPDQRGFGESEAPVGKSNYQMAGLVRDAIAVLDALDISQAHLVGHDWGALVGWNLAERRGSRFHCYAALSVGHPATQAGGDWEQRRKTWFRIFFRFHGIAEWILRARDWAAFRKLVRHHPETESWIRDLARPGRLTAALNWYRANIMELYMTSEYPKVGIPVMGVWSSEDLALAERANDR